MNKKKKVRQQPGRWDAPRYSQSDVRAVQEKHGVSYGKAVAMIEQELAAKPRLRRAAQIYGR